MDYRKILEEGRNRKKEGESPSFDYRTVLFDEFEPDRREVSRLEGEKQIKQATEQYQSKIKREYDEQNRLRENIKTGTATEDEINKFRDIQRNIIGKLKDSEGSTDFAKMPSLPKPYPKMGQVVEKDYSNLSTMKRLKQEQLDGQRIAEEYISKYGYLPKNASKKEEEEYYNRFSDETGLRNINTTDKIFDKSRILSTISDAIAPYNKDALDMLIQSNVRNKGNKLVNMGTDLVGNTIGLGMNPGSVVGGGKNLLNFSDDAVEGLTNKVLPKLATSEDIFSKVGHSMLKGTLDGAIGEVPDIFRTGDEMSNLPGNMVQGAVGGALLFGGGKAVGELKGLNNRLLNQLDPRMGNPNINMPGPGTTRAVNDIEENNFVNNEGLKLQPKTGKYYHSVPQAPQPIKEPMKLQGPGTGKYFANKPIPEEFKNNVSQDPVTPQAPGPKTMLREDPISLQRGLERKYLNKKPEIPEVPKVETKVEYDKANEQLLNRKSLNEEEFKPTHVKTTTIGRNKIMVIKDDGKKVEYFHKIEHTGEILRGSSGKELFNRSFESIEKASEMPEKELPKIEPIKSDFATNREELARGKKINTPDGEGTIKTFGQEKTVVEINGRMKTYVIDDLFNSKVEAPVEVKVDEPKMGPVEPEIETKIPDGPKTEPKYKKDIEVKKEVDDVVKKAYESQVERSERLHPGYGKDVKLFKNNENGEIMIEAKKPNPMSGKSKTDEYLSGWIDEQGINKHYRNSKESLANDPKYTEINMKSEEAKVDEVPYINEKGKTERTERINQYKPKNTDGHPLYVIDVLKRDNEYLVVNPDQNILRKFDNVEEANKYAQIYGDIRSKRSEAIKPPYTISKVYEEDLTEANKIFDGKAEEPKAQEIKEEPKAIEEAPLKDIADTPERKILNLRSKITNDLIPYDTHYRAYTGVSHTPEDNAKSSIKSLMNDLNGLLTRLEEHAKNDAQKEALANDFPGIQEKIVKEKRGLLHTKSGYYNTNISGPANYPEATMEKKWNAIGRKSSEYIDLLDRIEKAYIKKLDKLKTGEEVKNEETNRLIKEVYHVVDATNKGYDKVYFAKSFKDKLIRSANNGNIEAVRMALKEVEKVQVEKKITIFSKQNSIWKDIDKIEQSLKAKKDLEPQKTIGEYDGGVIIQNNQAERIQIVIDSDVEKGSELALALKKTGWHKTKEKIYQRMITNSSIYDAKNIMDKFFKKVEPEAPKVEETPKAEQKNEPVKVDEKPKFEPYNNNQIDELKANGVNTTDIERAIEVANQVMEKNIAEGKIDNYNRNRRAVEKTVDNWLEKNSKKNKSYEDQLEEEARAKEQALEEKRAKEKAYEEETKKETQKYLESIGIKKETKIEEPKKVEEAKKVEEPKKVEEAKKVEEEPEEKFTITRLQYEKAKELQLQGYKIEKAFNGTMFVTKDNRTQTIAKDGSLVSGIGSKLMKKKEFDLKDAKINESNHTEVTEAQKEAINKLKEKVNFVKGENFIVYEDIGQDNLAYSYHITEKFKNGNEKTKTYTGRIATDGHLYVESSTIGKINNSKYAYKIIEGKIDDATTEGPKVGDEITFRNNKADAIETGEVTKINDDGTFEVTNGDKITQVRTNIEGNYEDIVKAPIEDPETKAEATPEAKEEPKAQEPKKEDNGPFKTLYGEQYEQDLIQHLRNSRKEFSHYLERQIREIDRDIKKAEKDTITIDRLKKKRKLIVEEYLLPFKDFSDLKEAPKEVKGKPVTASQMISKHEMAVTFENEKNGTFYGNGYWVIKDKYASDSFMKAFNSSTLPSKRNTNMIDMFLQSETPYKANQINYREDGTIVKLSDGLHNVYLNPKYFKYFEQIGARFEFKNEISIVKVFDSNNEIMGVINPIRLAKDYEYKWGEAYKIPERFTSKVPTPSKPKVIDPDKPKPVTVNQIITKDTRTATYSFGGKNYYVSSSLMLDVDFAPKSMYKYFEGEAKSYPSFNKYKEKTYHKIEGVEYKDTDKKPKEFVVLTNGDIKQRYESKIYHYINQLGYELRLNETPEDFGGVFNKKGEWIGAVTPLKLISPKETKALGTDKHSISSARMPGSILMTKPRSTREPVKFEPRKGLLANIPKKDLGASRFKTKTVPDAPLTGNTLREKLGQEPLQYVKKRDMDISDFADSILKDTDLQKAMNIVLTTVNPGKEEAVLGMKVIAKLQAKGTDEALDQAVDLVRQISSQATNYGQYIQALSMFRKLTPEGMLRYAQKEVDNVVETIKKKKPGKMKAIEEEVKKVEEIMNSVNDDAINKATDEFFNGGLKDVNGEAEKIRELLKSDTSSKNELGNSEGNIETGKNVMEKKSQIKNNNPKDNEEDPVENMAEALKKKVEGHLNGDIIKQIDFEKDLVKTLHNIAKEVLPEREFIPVSPIERVKLMIENRQVAEDVWERAKDIFREEYGDNSDEYYTLQEWFDQEAEPIFFRKDLYKAINETMKARPEPIKINEIVREGLKKRNEAKDYIINELLEQTRLEKDEAKYLTEHIITRVNELMEAERTRQLEALFKEKLPKGKNDKIDASLKNIRTLSNLGAFQNEKYKNIIDKRLHPELDRIIKNQINIGEMVRKVTQDDQDLTGARLLDHILEETNLVKGEAETLAQAVLSRYNTIIGEKKDKILGGIFRNKIGEKTERKTFVEKLIELNNLSGLQNPKYKDLIFEKYGIPTLSNDEVKTITNLMNQAVKMKEGRSKDKIYAEVQQIISDKIPSSFSEKAKAIQRINLLLNFKTMARNLLGNVTMIGLENAKDIPGSAIDKLISLKTGERTTIGPSAKGVVTQAKGMYQGYKNVKEDRKLGIDTSKTEGQFEVPKGQAFKKIKNPKNVLETMNNVLASSENLVNYGLRLGDEPFYKGAYDERIRQLLKIGKTKVVTPEIKEQAHKYALDRTFQNVSSMSEMFSGLQKAFNLNKKFGIGNIIFPYTKTPGNIIDKAIDYTPVGTIRGLTNLFIVPKIDASKFNQKMVVDQLGRSLTGTGIIAMGYALASVGLLNGKGAENDQAKALEKQSGKLPYSFKIGNVYNTIDWMQPTAIPLMMGADIFEQKKSRKELDNILIEAVKTGGITLFNQSLLQGLSKVFGGYNATGGENVMDGLINTMLEAPGQFVPYNSALKQATQLIDRTVKETYDKSKVKNEVNKVQAKLPYLSSKVLPKIDTLGREVKQFNGSKGLKYIFDVLANPGFTSKYEPTKAEKLALELYYDSGETQQIPKRANNSIKYATDYLGEGKYKYDTIILSKYQKNDMQKIMGKKVENEFSKVGSEYRNLKTDTEKAEYLSKILSKIKKEAEDEILKKMGKKRYTR